MDDYFYRAFEERFYASREVIKELRRQYLPFVAPLAAIFPGASTFDVGCGRGEWLELMAEIGFSPFGVDLDVGMLSSCVELGLPAKQGDAIAHLKSLGSETQVLVTAFHVVEHIGFSELRTLVTEALRVLKPGGLLIMETPNPENLVVATKNFYLDPTHQRPIPPPLLEFLAEYSGFGRTKTLRLQESGDLSKKELPSLWNVISGASPDFAVVAQKKSSSKSELVGLDALFAKDFGFDTESLAARYESGLLSRLNEILVRVDRSAEAEAKAALAAEELRRVERQLIEDLRGVERKLADRTLTETSLRSQLERHQREADRLSGHIGIQQAEIDRLKRHIDWQQREWDAAKAEATDRTAEVEAILRSLSWRMTEPLRRLNALRHGSLTFLARIPAAVKRVAEASAQERPTHLALWLMRRPAILAAVKTAISPFPTIRSRFNKHMALARAATEPARAVAPASVDPRPGDGPKRRERAMSAHAVRVLRDLREGMTKR